MIPSTELPHMSFSSSAFKPLQSPINPPTKTPVAQPIPLQQPPTDQHRLFYGELTSQNHIPKHQYWSSPPERHDPGTPIPNTFNSQNPWMDTNRLNIHLAYQSEYSLFQSPANPNKQGDTNRKQNNYHQYQT